MNINLSNPQTFTRKEFMDKAIIENFNTYENKAVKAIAEKHKSLLIKSETSELSKEEEVQLKICKSEISSLKAVKVVNDNLSKEILYYRSKEVSNKCEELNKSLEKEISISKVRDAFEQGIINEETLEKSTGSKYFKREGTPGNYKYYYTESQYKEAKGKDGKSKEASKVTMNNLDWGKTTAERNSNLDKFNSLKTDEEKEKFIKELKGKQSESKQDDKSKESGFTDDINKVPSDPSKTASDKLINSRKDRIKHLTGRILSKDDNSFGNAKEEVEFFNKYSIKKVEVYDGDKIRFKDSKTDINS